MFLRYKRNDRLTNKNGLAEEEQERSRVPGVEMIRQRLHKTYHPEQLNF